MNRFYSFHADGTHNLIANSVICPAIFLNVKVIRLAGKAPAQDSDLLIRSPDAAMPVLEGVVDKVWSFSTEQPITTSLVGTKPSLPGDCSGTWRAFWGWEYLYVLVDVEDEAFVQDSDPS
ncbi:MAG: hypothetical protein D4R45_06790, partial [Planctomycetaceae bacterium]